ncbi:hypothetical protein FHT87_004590 [Rhizobium sp. BK316]|uniref:hypothetical protein n=1 Tax=Rhizobium sp. BK316 TaxID=2587053 RepID=UPI0016216EED|nr:hypothetical protein [Rhizobium sp. BK316]MBB3410658.1 hypothetical protein [Rhizobium sp. BK316]
MGRNLHISYDLKNPGQNYDNVIAAIKQLGDWAKIQYSYWYVNSQYTAVQARDHVWSAMDANDSLYVVDASNNEASWQNIPPESSKFIMDNWLK